MPLEETESILTQSIQAAIALPDRANLRCLLDEFEQVIGKLPQAKQLEVAGRILVQLVELYATRANQLLESWEERYNLSLNEPVLTADMLQEVLRHTMTLNLEEVIEQRAIHHRVSHSTSEVMESSVAATVEKSNVLEFLDTVALEEAQQNALAVSHSEDISAWTQAIAQWMQEQSCQAVPLVELQQSLQMPFVNLWLGVLLSDYLVEQRGEFYQTETIWVSKPPSKCISTKP